MPRIHCEQRMRAFLEDLEADGIPGVGFDVREECVEEWGPNYAIALIEIEEPPDELRDVYDLDAAIEKVLKQVRERFSSFEFVRDPLGGPITKAPKKAKTVLHVHRLSSGWTLEIEAYRRKA